MSLALVNARVFMTGILAKPSMVVPATLLVGGGAASGLILVEVQQGYKISNKLKEWWGEVAKFFSDSSKAMSSTQNSSSWLNQVGNFFSNAYSSSSEHIVSVGETFVEAFKWIFLNSAKIELNMLQDLQKSLGDSAELKELSESLLKDGPNFVKFWTSRDDRKTLTDLFREEKIQKTQKALKVLAGIEQHNSFKVDKGVSVYLMKELIRDPQKVSKKVVRFVDFMDKVQKGQTSNGGIDLSSSTVGNTQTYILTKQKLQGFLEERKEAAQDGWELGFLLEVGAKQKGVELGPLPSSAFSAVFDLLDFFSTKEVTAK